MSWFPLDQSLFDDNPKVLHLCELLDIEEATAIGTLTSLWSWSVHHAPDGVLPDVPRAIAKGAKWKGDPQVLIDALVSARWIDVSADGDLLVHDWFDWAGRNVQAQRKRRDYMRALRSGEQPDTVLTPCSHSDSTVSTPCAPKVYKGVIQEREGLDTGSESTTSAHAPADGQQSPPISPGGEKRKDEGGRMKAEQPKHPNAGGTAVLPQEVPTVLLTEDGEHLRGPLVKEVWQWCRSRSEELFPLSATWTALKPLEIALLEYTDLMRGTPLPTLLQDLVVTGRAATNWEGARYKFSVLKIALGDEIKFLRRNPPKLGDGQEYVPTGPPARLNVPTMSAEEKQARGLAAAPT